MALKKHIFKIFKIFIFAVLVGIILKVCLFNKSENFESGILGYSQNMSDDAFKKFAEDRLKKLPDLKTFDDIPIYVLNALSDKHIEMCKEMLN